MDENESEASSLENLSLEDDSVESIEKTIGSNQETEENIKKENILEEIKHENNFSNKSFDKTILKDIKYTSTFDSDTKNILKGFIQRNSSNHNRTSLNKIKKDNGIINIIVENTTISRLNISSNPEPKEIKTNIPIEGFRKSADDSKIKASNILMDYSQSIDIEKNKEQISPNEVITSGNNTNIQSNDINKDANDSLYSNMKLGRKKSVAHIFFKKAKELTGAENKTYPIIGNNKFPENQENNSEGKLTVNKSHDSDDKLTKYINENSSTNALNDSTVINQNYDIKTSIIQKETNYLESKENSYSSNFNRTSQINYDKKLDPNTMNKANSSLDQINENFMNTTTQDANKAMLSSSLMRRFSGIVKRLTSEANTKDKLDDHYSEGNSFIDKKRDSSDSNSKSNSILQINMDKNTEYQSSRMESKLSHVKFKENPIIIDYDRSILGKSVSNDEEQAKINQSEDENENSFGEGNSFGSFDDEDLNDIIDLDEDCKDESFLKEMLIETNRRYIKDKQTNEEKIKDTTSILIFDILHLKLKSIKLLAFLKIQTYHKPKSRRVNSLCLLNCFKIYSYHKRKQSNFYFMRFKKNVEYLKSCESKIIASKFQKILQELDIENEIGKLNEKEDIIKAIYLKINEYECKNKKIKTDNVIHNFNDEAIINDSKMLKDSSKLIISQVNTIFISKEINEPSKLSNILKNHGISEAKQHNNFTINNNENSNNESGMRSLSSICAVPLASIPPVPMTNIPLVPITNIPSVPLGNIPLVLMTNVPSVPIGNVPSVPIGNIPSVPIGNIPSVPMGNIPSVPGKIQNIPKIPSIPGNIPNIPSLPGQIPNIPGIPSFPGQIPNIPGIPSLPGKVPNLPGIPSLPGKFPNIPGIPSLPGKVPNLPGIPSLPGKFPKIPGGLPQIPGMAQLPTIQVQIPVEVQPKPPKDTNPKKLFWNMIPKNKIQNTFWMLQKLDAKVDYNNLCKLFCEPKKNEEDKKSKTEPNGANNPDPTKAVVKLLDDKRLMNLGIALAKANFTNEELKTILENFQEEKLTIEMIDKIISLAPNAEEIEKLKAYTGDTSLISNGERFCLALISVHKFMNKLEFIKFKKMMDDEKSDIVKKLKTFKEALQSIRSSVSFLSVLKLILKIGNYLNTDSAKGNAQGVAINTLNMLDSIKGIGKEKNTLLDFVVMNIRAQESSLINFSKDFVFFEEVLQIDLADVECKMKEFENGIKKIIKETELIEKENSSLNESFLIFLKELNTNASEKLNEIKGYHQTFSKELNDTAIYFGEDPKTIKIFEFVKLINDFVNNFNLRSTKLSAEEAKQMKKQIKEEKNPDNKTKYKKDLDNIKQTVTRKTEARKTALKSFHENNKEKLLDVTKIEDKSTLGDISMVLNNEKIERYKKIVADVKTLEKSQVDSTKIPVSILKNSFKNENTSLNALPNPNSMPETKSKLNNSKISKLRITKFKKKAKEPDSEDDMDDSCDYSVDNDYLMINQPLKINKLSNLNNQHRRLFNRAELKDEHFDFNSENTNFSSNSKDNTQQRY